MLLICYDTVPPEPLLATRGLATASGVALRLDGTAARGCHFYEIWHLENRAWR